MIEFEEFRMENYDDLLSMMMYFYRSDAVDHPIEESIVEKLLDDIISKEHPIKGYEVIYGGDLVGFGIVTSYYASEVAGMTIQLEDLFIIDEYRSMGIAKEYINRVREAFPQAARFRLEVCSSNERAIDLYKKLGFEELEYMQMVDDQV
ncbi:GNAT family acetyltransferase [Peptostreptococcus sp. MV1]|uniref:GNAT family N-acetyltransferase n=1 Tax=Peptostreptococcus sp. MV1 TaxID=1219626 RepID=UPI00050E78FA|nr:GNAT family N-acetyltransferase [Peptostreptococcus sp. MV1]KGF15189.1 GNAT family acetyltransferase [Peptostreptococcus sp. MV1]